MATPVAPWPPAGHTVVEWTVGPLPVEPAWLSPSEQARAGRFVEPLGHWWAGTRCWVRARLARRLGCAPAQVPLVTDERGRLGVPDLPGTGDLNVSHTNWVLALALSGDRVGIDVEEGPPPGVDPGGLAEVVGTPEEVRQLRALPPPERALAFQRWWVRKEAVLKADGAGFLSDPRLVHVGVTDPAPPSPWLVLDHGPLVTGADEAGIPHTLLATAHRRPGRTVGPPAVVEVLRVTDLG